MAKKPASSRERTFKVGDRVRVTDDGPEGYCDRTGTVTEIGPGESEGSPFAPRQLSFETSGYVQMELQGLDVRADDDRT